MKKFNFSLVFMSTMLASMFSSCRAIGDIFKAGVWFGVIGIVVVVVIILWLVGKAGKK